MNINIIHNTRTIVSISLKVIISLNYESMSFTQRVSIVVVTCPVD